MNHKKRRSTFVPVDTKTLRGLSRIRMAIAMAAVHWSVGTALATGEATEGEVVS